MSVTVSGSPVETFADAVRTALLADAALVLLVGDRIQAALKDGARTVKPYVVLARRDLYPGAVAMQREGGKVGTWVDVFSEKNGPHECQQIQSRIRAVLQRRTLVLDGFVMYAGSLVCEEEQVLPDFDPDMPNKSLFHGVQRWTADVEEAV